MCKLCANNFRTHKKKNMLNYNLNGITIRFVLDNRRENKSGKYPIKICVTWKRERKYYSTGKESSLEEWEKLPKAKSSEAITIKKDIQSSFEKIKGFVQSLEGSKGFSFDALNIQLGKGIVDSVNSAFQVKIETLKKEGRIGTKIFYECALNSIAGFAGENISFESVTVSWLKRYEKYMLDAEKSYTTIGMYLRGLRTIINETIKSGLIRSSLYPFGKDKYEIPEGEGRKLALTLQQIKAVVSYSDGTETTERYRDLWFFSYLCNGINMIDLLQLKYKDMSDGEISFFRSKTIRTSKKKTKVQAIITTEMKSIIKKWGNPDRSPNNYIFPFFKGEESPEDIKRITVDVTKRINLRMSSVSEALNLPHISTYTARHSYATVLKRSGANIAYISESLGHNDLKTTENYLASFEREERKKNASLLTNFGD